VDEIWSEVVDSFSARDPKALSVGLQMRAWVDANHMLSCLGSLPSNSHFFVASLNDVRSTIQKVNPQWNVTQKYHEGSQVNDLDQVRHALYDIFLVSLSDTCVISAHSTFGYLIMALKGSLCIFASDVADKRGKDCYWPHSHEICFHLGGSSPGGIFTNGCTDLMNKGVQINYGRSLAVSNISLSIL
jgi:hypothetical protein